MRSDYALYALAIVFFIIAAVTSPVVPLVANVDERNLYFVLTLVLGVMCAGVGYAMKPKVKAAVAAPQQEAASVSEEPAPQVAPAPVGAAPAEAPKAEAPVVETPKVEAPPPMIEAPKAATAALEKPAEPEALPPAPAVETPPIVAAAPAHATPLTQIRGINQHRADQLKANGINSVEELAAASAADLAVKLAVSEKIVKMWIGSAKKLAK